MSDETETFEIYFYDLSDDAKKRFLSFMRVKYISETNYDVFPFATLEVNTEVLEDNEKESKARERRQKREERRKQIKVNFT